MEGNFKALITQQFENVNKFNFKVDYVLLDKNNKRNFSS